jgi:hypothetical protein
VEVISVPYQAKALPLRFLAVGVETDDIGDVRTTARRWYLARIVAGDEPKVAVGGSLDGTCYFEVCVGDTHYWLTEAGLIEPPRSGER